MVRACLRPGRASHGAVDGEREDRESSEALPKTCSTLACRGEADWNTYLGAPSDRVEHLALTLRERMRDHRIGDCVEWLFAPWPPAIERAKSAHDSTFATLTSAARLGANGEVVLPAALCRSLGLPRSAQLRGRSPISRRRGRGGSGPVSGARASGSSPHSPWRRSARGAGHDRQGQALVRKHSEPGVGPTMPRRHRPQRKNGTSGAQR